MTQIPIPKHPTREWVFPSTKTGITPTEIRNEHLWGVDLRDPVTGRMYPDLGIWRQLRDAEDETEKRLSIRWRPTVIMSEPLKETPTSAYDEIEPAYPYEPDMHDVYRWGRLKLRKSPVTEVTEFAFAFPNRAIGLSPIPLSWVRIDAPFGKIHVIPDQGTAMASFASWLLSVQSGGKGIPNTIFVTYKVGASPEWWQANHRELLQAVSEMAAADVLRKVATAKAAKLGGSISISVDGMSQSRSNASQELLNQAEKRHEEAIKALDGWASRAKGPLLAWA